MRLTRLKVRAFRGFGAEQEFNLNAPFVLLVGPNGRGKTSFVDALQWALLGKIPRLTGTRDSQGTDYITNAFVGRDPTVELEFTSSDGRTVITRSGARGERLRLQRQTVEERQVWEGAEAEARLLHFMAQRSLSADDLYRHLTRTHILQQETLTDFLRAETPAERFRQLSRLLGLDAIAERGEALRRAAHQAKEELDQGQLRLQDLQRRREQIGQAAGEARRLALRVADAAERQQLLTAVEGTLREVATLTGSHLDLPHDFAALEAACQRGISALDAAGRSWVERRAALAGLWQRSSDIVQMAAERHAVQTRREAEAKALADLRQRLETARAAETEATANARRAAEHLRQAAGLRDTWVQFFHLGKELGQADDRCPLCHQPIAADALIAHIDAEVARLGEDLQAVIAGQAEAEAARLQSHEAVQRLQAEWDEHRRREADLQQQLMHLSLEGLQAELTFLGIEADDPATLPQVVKGHLQQVVTAIGRGTELRARLAEIAVAADAIGRSQTLAVYEAQLRDLDKQIRELESQQQSRALTEQRLQQNWTALETILLDDPMQNMDDISVLGLVDLLRYFSPRRQIILTTHSTRFSHMLLQKFHASAPEQPALSYTFAGWTRLGPVIEPDHIPPRRERPPLLLAQL